MFEMFGPYVYGAIGGFFMFYLANLAYTKFMPTKPQVKLEEWAPSRPQTDAHTEFLHELIKQLLDRQNLSKPPSH